MPLSEYLVVTQFNGPSPVEDWTSMYAPYLACRSEFESAALFRVLEGEYGWMALHDAGTPNAPALGEQLRVAATDFLSATAVDVEPFAEIFAAEGARLIAESSQFACIAWTDFDLTQGGEANFNAWYNTTHLTDVASAGLVRARRYKSSAIPGHYLATYDLWARDTLTSEALGRVRGFGPFAGHVRGTHRALLEHVAAYVNRMSKLS